MHLDLSFNSVVRPRWKYLRNLRCMGKRGVKEKEQGQSAYHIPSCCSNHFFLYTNTETKVSKMALLSATGNDRIYFLLPWMGLFFPLRWRQVSIINREIMDWQVLGLKHDSVNEPVGWFVGRFISWNHQWGLAVYWPVDSFAKQLIGAVLLVG